MSDLNKNINAELLEAAKTGDAGKVTSLINQGANVNVKDHENNTPLHLAAMNGYVDTVNALLKKETILIDEPNTKVIIHLYIWLLAKTV